MLFRRLLIKAYFAATERFNAAGKVLHAAFVGFWLAALDQRTLSLLDDSFYQQQPLYVSDARTLGGLMPWETDVVNRYFRGCSTLLLTGAGAGRELIALVNQGFRVDGFECNAKLLDYGNALFSRIGAPFSLGSMNRDQCPPTQHQYDGAIIGWGSYMHTRGRLRRITFLRDVRDRLKSGSPLLVSFFWRPAEDQSRDRLGLAAVVANVLTLGLRTPRFERGDALAPMYVHYFTEHEIRQELSESGFEVVEYSVQGYGHAVARASV